MKLTMQFKVPTFINQSLKIMERKTYKYIRNVTTTYSGYGTNEITLIEFNVYVEYGIHGNIVRMLKKHYLDMGLFYIPGFLYLVPNTLVHHRMAQWGHDLSPGCHPHMKQCTLPSMTNHHTHSRL